MKKLILALIIAAFSLGVAAQNSGFGIGVETGFPGTGISLKYWTGESTALDGSVTWSLSGNSSLGIDLDFIKHNFDLISVSKGSLPLYYGLGAHLAIGDNFGVAARVPVGLAYLFEEAPVDVFFELVPGIAILPDLDFYMAANLGARFFF